MTAVFHGGDLSVASDRFGDPAGGWVDLSTGINPRPWQVDAGMLDGLLALPDSARLNTLLDAAAVAYGVGGPGRIVAAPGTQALIQWLPRLYPAGRTAIVSPTYGEHAAAWRHAGHDVVEIGELPAAADFDAVVVTRPNNPDGRSPHRADIAALARDMQAKGGLLVVDEAFADLDPAASVAAQADGGLVALRSFGKFYGLPGLRSGIRRHRSCDREFHSGGTGSVAGIVAGGGYRCRGAGRSPLAGRNTVLALGERPAPR